MKRKAELKPCYYCGALAAVVEHDHFPIPKRHAGTETVPACINCHALKDRVALDRWPEEKAVAAFNELQSTIALSCIGMWGQWEDDPYGLPPNWSQLSPLARVLWAKLLCLRLDATERPEQFAGNERYTPARALFGLEVP